MQLLGVITLSLFVVGITPNPKPIVQSEVSQQYWQNLSTQRFKKDCSRFPSLQNAQRAKNVILLLGDGMGLPTISASRFYIAQANGQEGSATMHPFEAWPYNTMARTYDLETMVTDSASSATAYLTGGRKDFYVIHLIL